ncbi:PliI family lysozyme inhibitor of I-type lysozyme [Tamlana agarivorans]|uniref:PliI family lysozyme inhibitor of I-type lysozyme n=1 Tax=Pseudotamlana agarivorans TaxID=481183 RepID=A0ACC5U533_9FLAO|nr:PliI family lysozyme inhibitor of I-type lysozyme [Tamlana agarivorans]MBU2949385.1 PliI family lysozyme inhibitor of I-type lysozyme [Tamlana agarivorans]
MKKSQTILLALFGTLTIIACKNEQRKTSDTQIENSDASQKEIPVETEIKTIFQKTLTLQNISFNVKNTGEGSISELSIQPKGLEIDNQEIITELDGQVVNAEIEDLNSDGFPEILIYTVSAGSGAYGNVIAYSVNNGKSISQISFPAFSEGDEASVGYMGHDEFAIVETSLVRRFPIYKAGDSNNAPTGGTRQIQYKLIDGEASRVFVIDKTSTY